MAETVYQFEAMDNQGRALNLDSLRGKVILVVNVASKWVYHRPPFVFLDSFLATYQQNITMCNNAYLPKIDVPNTYLTKIVVGR